MASSDETPHSHDSARIVVSGKSGPREFCPQGGLMPDSSALFNEDLRCLLGRRLRVSATILFGGALAFLVRNLLGWGSELTTAPQVLVPHMTMTIVLGALAGLLLARSCLSLKVLRFFELLIFGLPALFFVWLEFCGVCSATHKMSADEIMAAARAFPAETTVRWMILINIYGIFIPNTCRRAAGVVAVMALIPLVSAVAASIEQPAVRQYLFEGDGLSAMSIWIAIAAVTAVYGSHRFGSLRREAFDARRMGSYTLRQKLGSGGMGDVYLAEHRLLKRSCAIKLIRPDRADDPSAIARFESEVRSTAKLTHPNTIEIYDYGHTNDGTFYYAMEFLPGMNLQEIVDRYGPLPPERVVFLLRQVCSALREAHTAGLIHRDVKPGNIFAAERGGLYDVAKLLDFGLVKSVVPHADSIKLTIDGTVIGSPLFACPETAVGETLDARSDIYSLGATAYFLLTGQPVFSGENPLKVIFAHANEIPLPPTEVKPEIPSDLESVVIKCLEKKPENRYTDVSALEAALAACGCRDGWTQNRAADWWSQTTEGLIAESEPASEADTATLLAAAKQ